MAPEQTLPCNQPYQPTKVTAPLDGGHVTDGCLGVYKKLFHYKVNFDMVSDN